MNKLLYTLIVSIFVLLAGCKEKPEAEDYEYWGYYPISNIHEHRLNESGIKKAQMAWDSIRPNLKTDSTVHGTEYQGKITETFREPMYIWLSFDVDKVTQEPSRLTFHMIPPIRKAPQTYMYFGDSIIPCSNKFTEGEYRDTVSIIIDRGLRRLIKGEGILIDTDRGKTEKLSPFQVKSLKQTLTAYEALALLYNSKKPID